MDCFFKIRKRWLSLFPGIIRSLQMFSASKSVFPVTEQKSTKTHFNEDKNELSEINLWHLHSLRTVFHVKHIRKSGRNSLIVEVLTWLTQFIPSCLSMRLTSLKIKVLLAQETHTRVSSRVCLS